MNVRVKNCKVLVCLILALALLMSGGIAMFARAAGEPIAPADTYKAKQIARYSLDEVKVSAAVPANGDIEAIPAYNYYEATDLSGAAIDSLRGVTGNTSKKLIINAMEGSHASDFMGAGANVVVSKFLPSDKTGFSVSAWMINRVGDWQAFLDAGGFKVATPNIDPFIPWTNNLVPGDVNKVNGGQWDSFKNVNEAAPVTANRNNDYFFITVSIDETGINFYKNGVKIITYPSATQLNKCEVSAGTHTIGDFVAEFLKIAKTGNVSFFAGDITYGDDLRIFNTLTDAEVLGLYNEASSLTISKIASKVGDTTTTLKEFTYDNAIAGAPSEDALYTINYVIGFQGHEDDNKPEAVFTAAKISDKQLVDYTQDVVITKKGTSERVIDTTNQITKFTETYEIRIGNMFRIVKINFIRNDNNEKAKTYLSYLKVSDVLVKNFDMATLEYSYALLPEVTAIPVVSYDGIMPELVTITDNKTDAFNGVSFIYTIEVKDKVSSELLNTYKITFTRATSAVVSKISLNGNTIHNFDRTKYFVGSEGAQNAYIDTLITDNSKVLATLAYADKATVKSTTIDGNSIKIVVTDSISNVDHTYALEQKVFSNETAPLYSFDFTSANLTEAEGSYVSADKKVATKNSVTVGENSVTLGVDGYIDVSGVFAGDINADGVTISTWMRMSDACKNQWSGVMALSGTKTLIVNNNQVLTGDYGGGAWNNEGTAANATAFKSDVYKYVTLVITKSTVILYVDGGVKEVEASRFALKADSIIGLGRSHMLTETLGSGEYKDIKVFNEPLSAESVMREYKISENAQLTSLKFLGSDKNVKDFAGVNFNYELDYSSSKTTPVAADFPSLVATNALGAVTNITKSEVDGASITYTITSEANGFSNIYTVKVTLVNNNYAPKKVEVKYSGSLNDIDATIAITDFKLEDGKMVASYKVWSGCDVSKLLINFVQESGQSKESESLDNKAKIYSVMLYAADASCMEYVIKFVEDATIASPDAAAPVPKKTGCNSSINGGAYILFGLAAITLIIVLKKKKIASK